MMIHNHDPKVAYKAVEMAEHMFFHSPHGQKYMAEYQQIQNEKHALQRRMQAFQEKYEDDFCYYLDEQMNN